MLTRFPENVVVVDRESLLHVRTARTNGSRRPEHVRIHRLTPSVFANGTVTPSVADEEGLRAAIRHIRQEAGEIDATSLLLPDSWFRIAILDLASIPDKKADADEVIRWTLRRNLPVQPEELRLAWHPIDHVEGKIRVLVIGASERPVSSIEKAFAAEDVRVVLVEPVGLSLWNAIAATLPDDQAHRIFFYVRQHEFTTAAFEGSKPLFIRSRSLGEERSMLQEIRLSASFVRSRFAASSIERCWAAGSRLERWITDALGQEFATKVDIVSIDRFSPGVAASDIAGNEAEVAASLGVFTA